MYCDGAVDFKQLGEGYENAVFMPADKRNLIDEVNATLIKTDNKWLIKDFDW